MAIINKAEKKINIVTIAESLVFFIIIRPAGLNQIPFISELMRLALMVIGIIYLVLTLSSQPKFGYYQLLWLISYLTFILPAIQDLKVLIYTINGIGDALIIIILLNYHIKNNLVKRLYISWGKTSILLLA
ncbi:hypothetical protein FACS1894184_15970 [Clostridia bacterium]|nr:hypothetical protein FACS1894184_15970 [Clostridia bacterium]